MHQKELSMVLVTQAAHLETSQQLVCHAAAQADSQLSHSSRPALLSEVQLRGEAWCGSRYVSRRKQAQKRGLLIVLPTQSALCTMQTSLWGICLLDC